MERSLLPRPRPQAAKRALHKVPFVELFDGRLQGVVSSGSDVSRVYVSAVNAGSGDFSCSTNNNRPCGGLGGSGCNHLRVLEEHAVAQYGAERVARYLGCEPDGVGSGALIRNLGGSPRREAESAVFARFLDYLRYLQLDASDRPAPELAWFVTG